MALVAVMRYVSKYISALPISGLSTLSEILAVVMSHSSAEGSRCLYTKEYQGFCSDSVRGIAMSCLCVVVQLLGRCDPEGWELKRAILCGNTISSSTSRLIALPVREAFSKHGLSPERAIYCT